MMGMTFISGTQRERWEISAEMRELCDTEAAKVFNDDLSCPFLLLAAEDDNGQQIIVPYNRSWVDGVQTNTSWRKYVL